MVLLVTTTVIQSMGQVNPRRPQREPEDAKPAGLQVEWHRGNVQRAAWHELAGTMGTRSSYVHAPTP